MTTLTWALLMTSRTFDKFDVHVFTIYWPHVSSYLSLLHRREDIDADFNEANSNSEANAPRATYVGAAGVVLLTNKTPFCV
jgi:hypothetical protein